MAEFQRWITPLQRSTVEPLPTGGAILHEDIPHGIDDIGPLLYSLFHEHWHQVQLSHVVEGSVLELEFSGKPKICILYDGYLTIVTETWHGHLCLEEHGGGPLKTTPEKLRMERRIQRASLYRRCNEQGEARSWGIQFWNGGGEKMMTIFLPNPYVTDLDEDLLPEKKPQIEKLALYNSLREIYVLGVQPIPFDSNPLKLPYIAVCRSSRCNPSRNWQPTFEALEQAVSAAGLDVDVMSFGCLEVCKLGPVVHVAPDQTWYTRVTPEVATQIVQTHLVAGQRLNSHLYPPTPTSR